MKIQSDNYANPDQDILGRNNIAKEITAGIIAYSRRSKEGLTISITGEWGSGKTTLLSYIKEQIILLENENIHIVEFNPWMFFKNESIKEAFLIHLSLSLNNSESTITKVSEKLTSFLKAFRWVKYFSSIAGNIQGGIEDLTTHLSSKMDVHEIKEDIEKLLKRRKDKILVFIDDIDRLAPSQISELFQTITLVTNFSNIIYVVAFDRQIVINAIDKDFSNRGQEYLEKIIQVDYEIPSIQTDVLERMFLSRLKGITNSFKQKIDLVYINWLWEYNGLKDYFSNIRDFKRFFNSFSFRLPTIVEEINIIDFVVIEAIRIFDYESYSLFYQLFKFNARKRELTNEGLTKDQFAKIESPASELIQALGAESGFFRSRYNANSKRLLDPAYFERYFSLSTSENDISERDIKELIKRQSVRKQILFDAERFGRMDNLIKRLSDKSIHTSYQPYNYTLINDLFDFYNQQLHLLKESHLEISSMLVNIICGNKKNRKENLDTFIQSFSRRPTSPSVLHIYFFHHMRLNIINRRSFRSDSQDFEDHYKKNWSFIETQFTPIFKSAVTFILTQNLTSTWPYIKHLYQTCFAELFPKEYPSFFDSILLDKKYLIYLAGRFIRLDEGSFSLHDIDWTSKDQLFPGEFLLRVYNEIKNIPSQSLELRERAIQYHFLSLDFSNFPEIKYPDTPQEYIH